MYYLKARYYDPSIGRFINEDTVERQIDNPLSLNLYSYCYNNPLIYSDPSGNTAMNYDDYINNQQTYRNPTAFNIIKAGWKGLVGFFTGKTAKNVAENSKPNTNSSSSNVAVPCPAPPNPNNKNDNNKNKKIFDISKLSLSQQKAVEKIDNIINDHLTEADFKGTLKDLQGNPIPKASGGYWNHMQEMKDSYTGLAKAVIRITKKSYPYIRS